MYILLQVAALGLMLIQQQPVEVQQTVEYQINNSLVQVEHSLYLRGKKMLLSRLLVAALGAAAGVLLSRRLVLVGI